MLRSGDAQRLEFHLTTAKSNIALFSSMNVTSRVCAYAHRYVAKPAARPSRMGFLEIETPFQKGVA